VRLQVIREIIEKLLVEDEDFSAIFLRWFQSEFAPYRSLWEFSSWGDYWLYIRANDIRTLRGEQVRSFEECEIANWLYLNGVKYEYETAYAYPAETVYKPNYKPDFFLPDYDVYLEHFAVSRDWKTPPFISERDYLEGIAWKRATHEQFGTVLIETYSYEKREGILLSNLREKLVARLGDKFQPKPISVADALLALRRRGRFDDFSTLVSTFLRHYKDSGIGVKELRYRASIDASSLRALAFVEVFCSIFAAYQNWLRDHHSIDFEDMIILATEYVLSGDYVSPYGYILVDEFQDISVGRSKLLKALLGQRPANQLFCVGDDWQSIYRFAGSEISVIRDFADLFGCTVRVDLEENFRCVDSIADVASKFVLRNESQMTKNINAVKKVDGPAIYVRYARAEAMQTALKEILHKISDLADGENSKVLLLGRYRKSIDATAISNFTREFPSLKLEFKTVHKAKGDEARFVVVLDLASGRLGFPTGMVDDPILNLVLSTSETYPHSEERRLFYVALTRAKEAVFLLADRNSPSSFVVELERGDYDIRILNGAPVEQQACPVCKEGRLTVRHGKYGDFLGCSFFPLCKHKGRIARTAIKAPLNDVGGGSRGDGGCQV
jgi:DNA helicase-4